MYRASSFRKGRKPFDQLNPQYRRRLLNAEQVARYQQENLAESTIDFDQNSVIDNTHLDFDNRSISVESDMSIRCDSSSDTDTDICSQSQSDVIRRNFAAACVKVKLNHSQINELLDVFQPHGCFKNWPNDARTLLQTPRDRAANICSLGGGDYVHFGMSEAILQILNITPLDIIPDDLVIDFSTDGGNLDKQAKVNVWPIQIRIHNIPNCSPEFVGIWCGRSHNSKPINSAVFLSAFIKNFNDLIKNGIDFKGIHKTVSYGSFIGDAPARAFVLGHMGHNADVPCSRCVVRRTFNSEGKKKALRTIDNEKRNDQDYRDCVDKLHHKAGKSCALNALVGFDIVNRVVFDYMHCGLLGITKRILKILVKGEDNSNLKLNELSIVRVNVRLSFIKRCCPEEFARKLDDITRFGKMKATEFRQILLYSGVVAFRKIMNDAMYMHFLLLSCAFRLLTLPSVNEAQINFAENLLKTFVQKAEEYYNHTFLTYNCHILLHMAEDVRRFGPLDGISAFPYENNMRYFAATCRKPQDYLAQIVNRREEERKLRDTDNNITMGKKSILIPGKRWTSSVSLPRELQSETAQYQTLKTPKYKININDKDNTFILKDKSCGMVQNIVLHNNKFKLLFNKFSVQNNSFFKMGQWESSLFGIYHCSKLSAKQHIIDVEDIYGKCFCMPYFEDENAEPTPDEFIVTLINSTIA